MSEPALSTILEAILFGAGRSMKVSELSDLLDAPQVDVEESLQNLRKTIKRRGFWSDYEY